MFTLIEKHGSSIKMSEDVSIRREQLGINGEFLKRNGLENHVGIEVYVNDAEKKVGLKFVKEHTENSYRLSPDSRKIETSNKYLTFKRVRNGRDWIVNGRRNLTNIEGVWALQF